MKSRNERLLYNSYRLHSYLGYVSPNQYEAEITIRQIMTEMVQLNEEHEFSYSREELIQMLDELLAGEM